MPGFKWKTLRWLIVNMIGDRWCRSVVPETGFDMLNLQAATTVLGSTVLAATTLGRLGLGLWVWGAIIEVMIFLLVSALSWNVLVVVHAFDPCNQMSVTGQVYVPIALSQWIYYALRSGYEHEWAVVSVCRLAESCHLARQWTTSAVVVLFLLLTLLLVMVMCS